MEENCILKEKIQKKCVLGTNDGPFLKYKFHKFYNDEHEEVWVHHIYYNKSNQNGSYFQVREDHELYQAPQKKCF